MVYTYNVNSTTATFDGNDDGSLTIIGSGDLFQGRVNNAITSYSNSGKSVSLPSTVLVAGTFTSLGDNAFINTGFTSIKFSEDSLVTTIYGRYTFDGCMSMTSLILPPKLTAIPGRMCANCSNLLTIFIPATVTSIGTLGFYNCKKLHTVAFGSGSTLTSMGDGVFYDCTGFARIEFPESFTSWSDQTYGMFGPATPGASIRAMRLNRTIFNNLTKNPMVAVPTGFRRLITFYVEDPIIYDNPSDQILNIVVDQYAYEQVMDITPSPYTGSMSLYGKGELTQNQVNGAIDQHGIQYTGQQLLEVTIGSEFTSLGGSAFQSTGFTSIKFSEDSLVTTMGNFTFYDCRSMISLSLPPKLTAIPGRMCSNCSKLETILIPATVTSIAFYAFPTCPKLHTVTFGPNSKLTFIDGGVFHTSTAIARIDFPESFTSWSNPSHGMFGGVGASIQAMRMNRSIFDKFNADNKTVLPAVPTGFRRLITFYGEDPIIYNNPSGQTLDVVVDQYAYEKVMDISPSPYTGSMSLYGKNELTAAQVTTAMSEHGTQFPGGGQPLKEITIGSDFTSVESNSFINKSTLQSVVFKPGSKVTTMGAAMFQNCTALTFIAFPERLTSIGSNTMNSSTNVIRTMKMNRSIWTNVLAGLTTTSNTQVVYFYDDMVYNTVIDRNLVPGTGITYDNGAFSGLYDGTLNIVGTGALPRSVMDTFITVNGYQLDLTINVDNTFTSLSDGVFAGHTGLTEVRFSSDSAIEALSARCFQGCSSLNTIVVSTGITTLGDQSFQGCFSFRNLIFPRGLVTGGSNVFDEVTTIQTLRVEEQLWESFFKSSLPENIKLVQFYGDQKILQGLETERDFYDDLENTQGYQTVVDYYLDKDTFLVDQTGNLVKTGDTGVSYDTATDSLQGTAIYDGTLTILSTSGELTQTFVDAAIAAHTTALNGANRPLHTLIVGDKFTSLSSSLTLQGTGITTLIFPAESPMTTTGIFRMGIDSTLAKIVALPKWVVQQGPWSLEI
jgi:hypothetical protein